MEIFGKLKLIMSFYAHFSIKQYSIRKVQSAVELIDCSHKPYMDQTRAKKKEIKFDDT